jgi:hypothetical protein
MSDARQYEDGSKLLIFRRCAAECLALSAHYKGLRFNQIRLSFLPPSALLDDPDREEIEIMFNISGSACDLLRHAFAEESWWTKTPPSGVAYHCITQGFGRAWRAVRTRNGYSVQRAQYADGMTKLASALQAELRQNDLGPGIPLGRRIARSQKGTADMLETRAKKTNR